MVLNQWGKKRRSKKDLIYISLRGLKKMGLITFLGHPMHLSFKNQKGQFRICGWSSDLELNILRGFSLVQVFFPSQKNLGSISKTNHTFYQTHGGLRLICPKYGFVGSKSQGKMSSTWWNTPWVPQRCGRNKNLEASLNDMLMEPSAVLKCDQVPLVSERMSKYSDWNCQAFDSHLKLDLHTKSQQCSLQKAWRKKICLKLFEAWANALSTNGWMTMVPCQLRLKISVICNLKHMLDGSK